jgi:hypothetical protein
MGEIVELVDVAGDREPFVGGRPRTRHGDAADVARSAPVLNLPFEPRTAGFVVFRPGLREHGGHERKEVVQLNEQSETLEVTGC